MSRMSEYCHPFQNHLALANIIQSRPNPAENTLAKSLRSDFGRTDFSQIFILGAAGFFRGFVARFFSSSLWEKVPRKILQENPRQILQNFHNKNPRHISAEGAGPKNAHQKRVRPAPQNHFLSGFFWSRRG